MLHVCNYVTHKVNLYLQLIENAQQYFNCQVTVVRELATVNHHCSATAMCSHSSDVRLQSVATRHHLGIGNYMRDTGLVLVHSVDYDTEVLGWEFFCLVSVFCILLSFNSTCMGTYMCV